MADIVYMAKSAWTALLDAIRSKGGTSALMTAAQAKAAVEAIETGGGGVEGSYSSYGNFYPNEIVYPSSVTDLRVLYSGTGGANNVVSIAGLGRTTNQAPGNQFRGMSNLKTVNLPRACHFYATAFRDCHKLESVELGSVGYPVVVTRGTMFQYDTQAFTITMYVDASTLAEANAIADVGALAPWGATNATIIFKSSTTGEVLE